MKNALEWMYDEAKLNYEGIKAKNCMIVAMTTVWRLNRMKSREGRDLYYKSCSKEGQY